MQFRMWQISFDISGVNAGSGVGDEFVNDAFQLPYIAGPVIVTQLLERFVGEDGAFASALTEIVHE